MESIQQIIIIIEIMLCTDFLWRLTHLWLAPCALCLSIRVVIVGAVIVVDDVDVPIFPDRKYVSIIIMYAIMNGRKVGRSIAWNLH